MTPIIEHYPVTDLLTSSMTYFSVPYSMAEWLGVPGRTEQYLDMPNER